MNILKYFLIFAFGFSVVWLGGKMRLSEKKEPSLENTKTTEVTSTVSRRRSSSTGKPPISPGDYQEAWEEFTQLDPRSPAYYQVQRMLIQDWLQNDCMGALSVLMVDQKTAFLAMTLINPETINENEDWIVASVKDHRFGLNGRFLLDALISKRPNTSAESMWKFVDLVDPKNQRKIFLEAFQKPENREAWLKKVETLPTASVRKRARSAYIRRQLGLRSRRTESLPKLIASVQEMENPEARADMGEAIMSNQWDHYHPEKTIALLDSMESEMYNAALDMAITRLPTNHPTDELRKNLNAYIDGGHFEAFNRIDEKFLQGWTFDDEKMRDWAWNLPERSESARIVRGTVSRKFSKNPASARKWLANKDAGWHKDQAMVELARVAKKPSHAGWILQEITDPALRSEAEEFLQKR